MMLQNLWAFALGKAHSITLACCLQNAFQMPLGGLH
jgi:hypothetical protein